MKITKSQLKRIIKEEYRRVLEQPEFKTGVPEEDVLAHGLDLEMYPTTPEELESDRIAQELENAWVGAGNPEKYLGYVDNDILDMAMAVRDGEMEMEDALAQVASLGGGMEEKKDWMQDIKSTGECTPYTKPGCTGKAKAFAKRAQKGDVHDDNLKKGKNPHGPG